MRITIRCLLLFVSTLYFVSGNAQSEDRPNILWIVSEDNSPLLGCYGDTFATTPNLDKLATQGVLYTHAFATAPVCAPSRSTLITGMYPSSLGTEHMRSTYPVPALVRFFPGYLREAGYYTSNNVKKDYNTTDQPEVWDESSTKATYLNRQPGQPFFAVFNTTISHESSLHTPIPTDSLRHDPEKVPLPPYHPATPEMKHDWAQYYDKIEAMDAFVGKVLKELEEAGLAENTIVFYYSDHGGVLGRSKRFMFESGLRIPMIIRFPRKYAHLAPGKPGSTTDRIVSFADFAPTILSLAGVPVPQHMQGNAFLGKAQATPQAYAYAFRGRMDERMDMVRSVRDARYRYVRNYMPHKIYGQYLEYLWKAPSMDSWEKAYRAGELNEIQAAFWKPKPVEELYDVEADPHNIHNLAGKAEYQEVLLRLREANRQWLLATRDAGFIPEALMEEIAEKTPLYAYTRSGQYPLERIMETAGMASEGNATHLPELTRRLGDTNPVVRYWAVTGCVILKEKAGPARKTLEKLLQDPQAAVRIAAAEALYGLGDKEKPAAALTGALKTGNRMARVQALNVLEDMGRDAAPAITAARALLKDNPQDADYDARAAKRLLDQLASLGIAK